MTKEQFQRYDEPSAKEQYLSYDEPSAKDQYLRYDEPSAKEQYQRYDEPTTKIEEHNVASKEFTYKQFDTEYKPYVSHSEEVKHNSVKIEPATENKSGSEQVYITPLNDLPHKKKAVNISDILMKYSK